MSDISAHTSSYDFNPRDQFYEHLALHEEFGPPAKKDWLVRGVLAKGEVAIAYGDPEAGKSNFAVHLASHVGGGFEWFGRETGSNGEYHPRGVLYISAERGGQVRRRIQAMGRRLDHECLPVVAFDGSLRLADRNDDLLTLVEAASDILHGGGWGKLSIDLVIIDTLSAALGSGDSDETAVSGFLENLRNTIRATGAAFLVLHHTPQSGAPRPRGHGSLLAAADSTIHIKKKGDERIAQVIKNNDSPDRPAFRYRLESEVLHTDEFGVQTSASVVVPCIASEALAAEAPASGAVSKTARAVLKSLVDLTSGSGEGVDEDAWRAAYTAAEPATKPHTMRTRFHRAKAALLAAKYVSIDDGICRVTN